MLQDIKKDTIKKNKTLNTLFISAIMKDINEECKILKGDFYLDSFNYFPVTTNYNTFYELCKREDDNSIVFP